VSGLFFLPLSGTSRSDADTRGVRLFNTYTTVKVRAELYVIKML